jgi:hypothetical protein
VDIHQYIIKWEGLFLTNWFVFPTWTKNQDDAVFLNDKEVTEVLEWAALNNKKVLMIGRYKDGH